MKGTGQSPTDRISSLEENEKTREKFVSEAKIVTALASHAMALISISRDLVIDPLSLRLVRMGSLPDEELKSSRIDK